MKTILSTAALLLLALTGYGQAKTTDRRMLTDTEPAIRQYRVEEQKAWEAKNESLALAYRDSMQHSIIGSYIEDHTFRTLDGKEVKLRNLNKPLLLITSATWCAPCVSEIPALNKVAKEYADKVAFIVLFHDTKDEKLMKLAKKFSSPVMLVPSVKKEEDELTVAISGFRYILGYPTNYLIDPERRIIGFSQGAAVAMTYINEKGEGVTTTQEQANELNYAKLKEQAEQLLNHAASMSAK